MPSGEHSKTIEKSLTTENVVGYIESGGAVCTIPDSHIRQTHGMYVNHTHYALIMHKRSRKPSVATYVCTYVGIRLNPTDLVKGFSVHRNSHKLLYVRTYVIVFMHKGLLTVTDTNQPHHELAGDGTLNSSIRVITGYYRLLQVITLYCTPRGVWVTQRKGQS